MRCHETARLGAGDQKRPGSGRETGRLDACDRKRRETASAVPAEMVIARYRQSVIWSRNQSTVAATASGNGVAVQPKARSNLVLSTTQARSD
jgi:hypothetical protein